MTSIKGFINKSVKTLFVSVMAITAIVASAVPMSASAMKFDEAEYYNDNNNYEYIENEDTLEVYGNIDNAILRQFSGICSVRFVESKVGTVSFEGCDFSYLEFSKCDLSSAKIEGAKNINSIYMDECKMSNFDFLKSAENAIDLCAWNCELGSADGIENMTNLEYICFSIVGIEDITPFASLKNLERLTLDYTCVKDLSPLKDLDLSYLCVDDSMNIESFDDLIGMTSLETISTGNCEMAYTKEFYDFLNTNNVYHDVTRNDLKIKDKVKEIADQLETDNMSDEEKIETVVNYVVDRIDYDERALTNDKLLTIYNDEALKYALQGTGVCRNYSALVNVLLTEMGVNVSEIRNEDHIWNIVIIDDEYFWIDATWIDDGCTMDVTENMYYCNTDYYFVDHSSLTVPATVYNMEHNTNTENDIVDDSKNQVEETEKEIIDKEVVVEEIQKSEKEETTTVKPQKMETRLDKETPINSNTFDTENTESSVNEIVIGISAVAIIMATASIIILSKKYVESK